MIKNPCSNFAPSGTETISFYNLQQASNSLILVNQNHQPAVSTIFKTLKSLGREAVRDQVPLRVPSYNLKPPQSFASLAGVTYGQPQKTALSGGF